MYYGTLKEEHTIEIAKKVVRVLGGGKNALSLITETAMQETVMGCYRDRSGCGAGIGLCQCDPIAFHDTQERTSLDVKNTIRARFGVDVDSVGHRELAFSPLLSLLWCRMHYLLRPGAIPDTVEGRAAYWKKWYNSEIGKGTEDDYLCSANYLDDVLGLA